MFDGIRVSPASLVQQFLQGAAVVERLLDLWDELVRNVDADASPFDPAIEDVAGVLVAPRTCLAVFADAGAPSETERPERGWPEACRLCPEPALDLARGLTLARHTVYVPQRTHTVKHKPLSCDSIGHSAFCDRN